MPSISTLFNTILTRHEISFSVFAGSGFIVNNQLDKLLADAFTLGTTGVCNISSVSQKSLSETHLDISCKVVSAWHQSNVPAEITITSEDNGHATMVIVISFSRQKEFQEYFPFTRGYPFTQLFTLFNTPQIIFSSEQGAISKKWNTSLIAGLNFVTKWDPSSLTGLGTLFNLGSDNNLIFRGSLDPSLLNYTPNYLGEGVSYPAMALEMTLPKDIALPKPLNSIQLKSPAIFLSISDPGDLPLEGWLFPGQQKVSFGLQVIINVGTSIEYLLNAEIERASGKDVFSNDYIQFQLVADASKTLTLGDLSDLALGSEISPDSSIKTFFNQISLNDFRITFIGATPVSIYFMIGTPPEMSYDLIEGLVMRNINLHHTINNPTKNKSTATTYSADLDFSLNDFNGVFELEISSDLKQIGGSFSGIFNLTDIIADVVHIPNNFPEITFINFGISLDKEQRFYSFYADAEVVGNDIPTSMPINSEKTFDANLNFSLQSTQGSKQFSLRGGVTINDYYFQLQIALIKGNCSFQAYYKASGSGLQVGTFLNDFLTALEIENAFTTFRLDQWDLDQFSFSYGTGTKDLSCQIEFGKSAGEIEGLPANVSTGDTTSFQIDYNGNSKNFTFSCATTLPLNGKSPTLLLDINLTHNQNTYEKSFEGKLTLANNVFDVKFDEVQDTEKSSLLLGSYSDPDGNGINVSDLAADLGVEIGSLGGLSINDIALAQASASGKKTSVLTASFKGGFDLTNLPLVGRYFSKNEKVQFNVQPILFKDGIGDPKVIAQISAFVTQLGLNFPDKPKSGELIATLTVGNDVIHLDQYSFKSNGNNISNDSGQQLTSVAPGPSSQPIASGNIQWYKLQKTFGPLQLEKVGLNFTKGDLEFLLDASLSGAGLTLSLIELSISSPITDFKPSFGIKGIGIDYHKDDVSIGGMFLEDGDDYDGMALIETDAFSLSVLGSYTSLNGHPSLFLYAVLDKSLGGPSFFFVTGLAAGFGYNRNLLSPTISQIPKFPLVSFAANPSAAPKNLTAALTSMHTWIPPQVGEEFFAVGVRFTTFEMIQSFALLTVKLGQSFEIDVLGLSTLIVPTPDPTVENPPSPLAEIQMAVKASYVPAKGFLGVQAQLTSSSFLLSKNCHLTGGFAFYSWFSGVHEGDFVITLGGYHPKFTVPSYYPQVPKLGFDWKVDNHLSLSGHVYYALVPHALMAGGAMSATYDDGNFKAWFDAGIDFLIAWQPYHYTADAYIDLGASYTLSIWGIHHTFSVHLGADLSIWGPDFSGIATLEICGVHLHVSFGENRKTIKPLTWDQFEQSFLPKANQISIKATSGLINQVGDELVLDPDAFMVEVNTTVPLKSLSSTEEVTLGTGSGDATPNFEFGIAPMNKSSDEIESDIQVSFAKGNPGDFKVTPILKSVPTGLWGQTDNPGVNDPAFITNACTGLVLSQQDTPDPGSTQAIEKSELAFTTTGPEYFQWGQVLETNQDKGLLARMTIANDLGNVSTERQEIFSVLGFSTNAITMHNPLELANELLADPEILQLAYRKGYGQ